MSKADDDKDNKDNVDDFNKVFKDFKEVNDKVIKDGKDARAEDKVKLNKMQDAMDKLEAKFKRPDDFKVDKEPSSDEEAEHKIKVNTIQKKAWLNYCRIGKKNLSPDELKVLTVADSTTGGFLSPDDFVQEMIKEVVEFSPIRSIANVRQTSRRSIEIPKRTGVFAALFVGEQGTQDETDGLRFGLEEIPTHKLFARVDITDEDLADPVFNMEAILRSEFSEQFGVAEGKAFVDGNGVTRPQGLTTNADVTTVASQDATLITADGLIALHHEPLSFYWPNAKYLMHRSTIREVRLLKDTQNRYLFEPGLNGDTIMRLLGKPIMEVPDLVAPDSAGVFVAADEPILYGDFKKAYTIVDRMSMSVLRDPFTSAGTGVVRFFARRRLGGQVVLAEAFKKQTIAA